MKTVCVTFQPEGTRITVPIGTTFLEAARLAQLPIVTPCGGQSTCGRCRVLLRDRGSVLACQETVTEDVLVEIPVTARPEGTAIQLDDGFAPGSEAGSEAGCEANNTIRSPSKDLGLAVDLGTSTIAAELVDLQTGGLLARAGKANGQAAYGAEVTRRMEHAEDHGPGGLAEVAVRDLVELTEALGSAARIDPSDIRTAVIAGNAPMIHLLYRLDPTPILRAPHEPVAANPPPVPASALGFETGHRMEVRALPWIGGWVGGDITAGILATGIHKEQRLTLFLDVGTNGEIVLGNRDWRVACAASAGPAFEGCGIRDGTNARRGAIDRVSIERRGGLSIETIGGAAPLGICGTGLISAVAACFRAGWIDRRGRIDPARADDVGGEKGIRLVPGSQAAPGRPIALVQRDIDAAIRAKAALFAGIRSLLGELDLTVEQVERWIIAGGFGSRLDPHDAIDLGLIGDVDPESVEFAGNTSLRGARMALLDRSAWEEAEAAAGATTYLELIDRPGYFEEFTSACFIPHTDLSLFKSRTPQRRNEP